MKIRKILTAFLFSIFLILPSFGQKEKNTKPNPAISKMVKDVSAQNIETYICKLVSFGTRNTLSDQTSATRGIGAASNWIFEEFQKISKDCGNCLTVEKQTFLQEKSAARSRTD